MDKGKLAALLTKLGDADDDVVLAAAREAHRLVTEGDGSWRDALGLPPPPSNSAPATPQAKAAMILEWFEPRLRDHEKTFLADMARQTRRLTEPQHAWVQNLYTRFTGRR